MPGSRPGFDPKTFDPKTHLLGRSRPIHDPWAKSELWRKTGPFTRFNRFKGAVPGFGTALVAFAAYCTYEHFFMKDDHHHETGHGTGH